MFFVERQLIYRLFFIVFCALPVAKCKCEMQLNILTEKRIYWMNT